MHVLAANTDPSIPNPLNGILPDFTIFGAQFTELWQKLIAGMWGIGIVLTVVFLIVGVTQMASASSGGNPMEYKTARTRAMWAAIALGVLAALAVIVGGVLTIFG